ncbi:DEAD/DEAH box helicase [Labedaea rhizosphaerae]|uniref:Helicase-like protein n=1 Tax=Labedaea rhizosphaerae TaxID=598644 RepID=A0A4R6SDC1_LABRH|nr:DEAD/DEAH box helicase [Labedaea rhizosphaerae]TDP97664.1 helicase-like protein [Labedaea rhizosphaerae]
MTTALSVSQVAVPPYAVYADLTADGTRVVLLGVGAPAAVAYAARLLGTVTPLCKPTGEIGLPAGGMTVPVSWPAVVQLAATFGSAWRPQPRLAQWITAEAGRRTAVEHQLGEQTPLAYRAPDGLTPRPYQVDGARLIAATGAALITDEPGTGKTITTILGLAEHGAQHGERSVVPVLVVCPASVVDSWVSAWRTWAPTVRTVAWRGTQGERRRLIGTADVYVVSYDTARRDAPVGSTGHRPLLELRPVALVIDECHMIKSPTAKRTLAVQRLARAVHKVNGPIVALSGTPITHNPSDLWPTLNALDDAAWPSRERWVGRYCLTVAGDYDEDVLGLLPEREAEFRLAILGQHRRVAKADVLDQLPPKVYSVRTVELPAAYRKAYDQMECDMLAQLPDGDELPAQGVLMQLTCLNMLAAAAADVEVEWRVAERGPWEGQERPHYHVKLKAPSWKVDELLAVLEERGGPRELAAPVIAFAPSKQLVELAGAAATKAGYRVGYVVGGQNAKDRTATVEAFQAGHLDLICVTTSAGGVGITLTAARTVVFLQRPWSIVDALQAEDRAHRIGSEIHESIEVIDIVAADTVDARVRDALRDKAQQLSDLVQDPRIVAELLGGEDPKPLPRKQKEAA